LQGIEIQVIWYDQDVVEYRFTCSNGKFCGQVEAYLAHEDLLELAQRLKGFPAKPGDCREFELGTFDAKCAGGGFRLCFSRLDSPGHSVVDLELRSDSQGSSGHPESVAMRILVEAGAIDCFISEIAGIGINVGAKAHLLMSR